MTIWTKEASLPSPSIWTLEAPLGSDLGAGLDELLNLMTDETDTIILFHNGEFETQDTPWTIL